ncbi:MAG: hypothetical protein RBS43_03370 [Candidatus Cloacimonas sp.]|nr:hypothetical protein [Candidatus Cloacimonas sp.]
MKKFILLCVTLSFVLALFAQGKSSDIDQWLYEQPQKEKSITPGDSLLTNDLIQVNYQKKDARLAMAMSLLVPGAGQFYADKSSITTYIFPVIELSMIGGLIYYTGRGNDKTDAFEKYATGEIVTYITNDGTVKTGTRYNRAFQNQVQEILKGINAVDIYDNGYFRLDNNNSQHFYEDIGKYPHYVLGWVDWYYRFAADESGNFSDPHWSFDGTSTSPNARWRGNFPLWGSDTATAVNPSSADASPMRQEYIKMRNDAKAEYAIARTFTFGLAFNHIVSGLDAVRLTHKRNRLSISQAVPQMNFYAAVPFGNLTPMLGLKWQM